MKKLPLLLFFLVLFSVHGYNQNTSATEKREMLFRIIELEKIGKDSLHAYLYAGSKDGIQKGLIGTVLGKYSKREDRYNVELGFASVIALNDTLSLLLLKPNEKSISNKNLNIQQGDLISLKVNVPILQYRSIFFELGCLNIFFKDIYGKSLYKFSDLVNNDSKVFEKEIIKKALQDIFFTYEYYKDSKDTTLNLYRTPLDYGRYTGKSIFDVMKNATEKDVLAYINTVKTYPVKYIGKDWKIALEFAEWVRNGAYYSKAEMRDSVLLYANNSVKLKAFLSTHKETFIQEDFVHKWLMDATDETDSIAEKSLYAAKLVLTHLPNDQDWGTYHYVTEQRLTDKGNYKKAIEHCDSTLNYYTKSKNSNGIVIILFEYARCYYNLENYSACLKALNKANAYNSDINNSIRENTRTSFKSYFYRLSALCYYNAQDYKLAVENFIQYINLAKSNGSFSDVKSAISMQNYLTKIYEKQGETVKALEIYTEQLELFIKLNDQPNIAATYDKIASVNYKLGNYRLAINDYTKAKRIHLNLNDINSAGYSQSNIGLAYWNLGKYDSSIACHQQAIAFRKQINNFRGLGYSWKQLGDVFTQTGEKEKSFAAYDSATQYYTLAKDTSSISNLLSSYGDIFSNDKQYQKAFSYYYKWHQLNIASKNKSDIVSSSYQLAWAAFNFNIDTAKKYFTFCLSIANEIGDKSNAFYALLGLGSVAYKELDYGQGEKYFQAGLDIAIKEKNKKLEALGYRIMGSSYSNKLDFDNAFKYLTKSITLYDSLGDKASLPLVYRYLASALQGKGEFYEARKQYLKSIDIAYQNNNRADVAYGYNDLTFLYIIQGELKKAEEAVDSSYAIFKNLNNSWQIASSYFNMGLVYEAKADGVNAVKHYKMADSIYILEKDVYSRSTCHTNIGAVYYYQADYVNALKYFFEADKFLSNIKTITEAHILAPINIGETYFYLKDYVKAEKYLVEGYKLATEKKAGRMHTISSSFLGTLYYEMNKLPQSEKYLLESFALAQKSNESDLYINTGMYLGKLYASLNQPAKSEEYYRRTINFIITIDNSKYTWMAYYEYGLNQYNQNKLDTAIVYFKKAIEIVENSSKNLFGGEEAKKIYSADSRKVDLYNKLVAALAKTGKKEDALFFANKSNNQAVKELIDNAGLVTNDKDKAAAIKQGNELLSKKNAVDQAIAKEKSKPENEQNKQLIASLESVKKVAENDYTNFITNLRTKYQDLGAYFAETNPSDFKNYIDDIPDSTIVVLYVINDNQLFIFTVTNKETGIKTVELKQDLNKQAGRFLSILRNPNNATGTNAVTLRSTLKPIDDVRADFKTEANALYALLITPIAEDIKDKRNICFIPNGKLSSIPFQSLGYTNDKNEFHFLMEDYTIFYTSKIDIFRKNFKKRAMQSSLALFGNPDKTLPGATLEAKAIAGLINGSTTFIEENATEDKAKESLAKYNYIHFATHGVLDYEQAQNSYLLFAAGPGENNEGKLTIAEINGITKPTNSLVVLSACETAVRKEESKGFYISPTNAFLNNRVDAVVGSLWKVPDETTNLLLQEFYNNLEKKGMGKAEALRQAQATVSSNPKYHHPFYWSAFVLYGEWR